MQTNNVTMFFRKVSTDLITHCPKYPASDQEGKLGRLELPTYSKSNSSNIAKNTLIPFALE